MRSAELQMSMFVATLTLDEIAPKIAARLPLTPGECSRLLNTNWTVYLYAVADGELAEAKEAKSFDNTMLDYVKLHGYSVTFKNNVYCITGRKSRRSWIWQKTREQKP